MSLEHQFPIDKKKKLASKISELRNKEDLKKIKKIIFETNPNIAVNKDSGGILMFFQNLNFDTYIILENYLKEIEMRKITNRTHKITRNSEKLQNGSDSAYYNKVTISDRMIFGGSDSKSADFKYSNKEKNIIRKKEYDKIIRQTQSEQIEACSEDKKLIIKNDKNIKNNKNNTIFSKNDA